MIDSIAIFKAVAAANDMEFLHGRIDDIEGAIIESDLSDGTMLMYVDPVNTSPVYVDGLLSYRNYDTSFAICVQGMLDQYYGDKYIARLRDLVLKMEEVLLSLGGCSTLITITAAPYNESVNRFSANLDCIVCNIQYSDE